MKEACRPSRSDFVTTMLITVGGGVTTMVWFEVSIPLGNTSKWISDDRNFIYSATIDSMISEMQYSDSRSLLG